MNCLLKVAFATALTLQLVACTTTTPPPPAMWDGMKLRLTTDSGALYLRPAAETQVRPTVLIDPLVVSTDKRWWPVRDVRTGAIVGPHPLSDGEMQCIEDTIDPVFRRLLVTELNARGYQTVEQPTAGTLRVSTGLAYVFIDSPSSGMFRLRRDDAMTLVLTLSDSSTGRLFARLIDTKRNGKTGMLESPNTVANNLAFRDAVKDWARMLGDTLDMVSGEPGAPRGSVMLSSR